MNHRKSPTAASIASLAPPSPTTIAARKNRRLSFVASTLTVACFLALKASLDAMTRPERHTLPTINLRALESASSFVTDINETSSYAFGNESTIDTTKTGASNGDESLDASPLNDDPAVDTKEPVDPENKSEAWKKPNKAHAVDITQADSLVQEPTVITSKTHSLDKHQSESRSEPIVSFKKPSADAQVSTSRHDPEIALVAVVSMQRSFSTMLTNRVLTNNETNPCALSLNEIFVNTSVGSKDAWPVDGTGTDLRLPMFQIKPRALRDFVMRVAKRRCVNHLHDNDADNVCRNRCIVGFKEFDNQLSLEQHKWLWRNTPNLTIVVLERNVQDRWKSNYVATQTGDLDTQGSLNHKNQIAARDIPPMNVSETDEYCKSPLKAMNSACNFGQNHKEWYEFVRAKIHSTQKVEISFDAAILNGGSYARGLIASALPSNFRELLISETERISDPELAFIAVASMQRSASTTLVSEVLSSNKTNPCTISLNEVFLNSRHQSGDAWPIDGRHLQNSDKGELKPALLQDFLVRVAKRRCVEQLKSRDTRNMCENRCIVAFKQFHEHLNTEQHKFLWKNIPNMTVVVLERNVRERWKSRFVAEKTNDWHTHGSDWHKKRIKTIYVPPMNVSESDEFCKEVNWKQLCHFEQKHKEWFNLVRETTPVEKRAEISYEDVVENKGETARANIAAVLPIAFQPIITLTK